MCSIREKVYGFKTKYPQGLTPNEIEALLVDYPNINMDKFNNALYGDTCMLGENDEPIRYHHDIIKALNCGIENRDVNFLEWD